MEKKSENKYFMKNLLRFTETVAKRVKKDSSYTIDNNISVRDLSLILLNRFVNMLRGLIISKTFSRAGKHIFIGRDVRISHRNHIQLGSGVTIKDCVIIDGLSTQGIIIGNNVSIGSYTIIRNTGVYSDIGVGFSIGDNSNIGEFGFIGGSGGIKIGQNVLIGQRVSFHSENHNFSDKDTSIKSQGTYRKGIEVEDDCWIGGGSTILDGIKIHSGAIVAAGSVVTEDVPSKTIVGGVPARVIKDREKN